MHVFVRDNNIDQALRVLKKKLQRKTIEPYGDAAGHHRRPRRGYSNTMALRCLKPEEPSTPLQSTVVRTLRLATRSHRGCQESGKTSEGGDGSPALPLHPEDQEAHACCDHHCYGIHPRLRSVRRLAVLPLGFAKPGCARSF